MTSWNWLIKFSLFSVDWSSIRLFLHLAWIKFSILYFIGDVTLILLVINYFEFYDFIWYSLIVANESSAKCRLLSLSIKVWLLPYLSSLCLAYISCCDCIIAFFLIRSIFLPVLLEVPILDPFLRELRLTMLSRWLRELVSVRKSSRLTSVMFLRLSYLLRSSSGPLGESGSVSSLHIYNLIYDDFEALSFPDYFSPSLSNDLRVSFIGIGLSICGESNSTYLIACSLSE